MPIIPDITIRRIGETAFLNIFLYAKLRITTVAKTRRDLKSTLKVLSTA